MENGIGTATVTAKLENSKATVKNYVDIAMTAIEPIYQSDELSEEQGQISGFKDTAQYDF